VKNDGMRIPEGNMETIFKPYCSTKEKGTSLGLVIRKKIVENHQGIIKAASINNGTAFRVLPQDCFESVKRPFLLMLNLFGIFTQVCNFLIF
jgi:nitrogen-specific signal transduction histidine kinase